MSEPAPNPQPDLFTSGPDPRARIADPETSHEAAASMREGAETHRRRILHTLRAHGPKTGDGLDEHFGWNHATANRRLPELREAGQVEMLTKTALTRSGRRARLWRALPLTPSLRG